MGGYSVEGATFGTAAAGIAATAHSSTAGSLRQQSKRFISSEQLCSGLLPLAGLNSYEAARRGLFALAPLTKMQASVSAPDATTHTAFIASNEIVLHALT